jgi:hypothetical protein
MPGQMEDAAPRKEISNEWVLIIGGIISIIFGVVLVANPAAGAPISRRYGPQESTETTTGRKGQTWKLSAYFLGLYVVTFAANQVVIRHKDVAQAERLIKIGSMIARPSSSVACPDRAPPCCRPRRRAFPGGFLARGDGMAKRLRVGLYARVSTHDQQTLPGEP